jgi:hypothetical protein
MRTVLAIASLGAALICGWLTVMYFLLGHDGWMWRAVITGALLVYCVVAVFTAEQILSGMWVERLLVAGSALAIAFAMAALTSLLSTPHFEGFWLPVAASLIVQAGLTLAVFARPALFSKA